LGIFSSFERPRSIDGQTDSKRSETQDLRKGMKLASGWSRQKQRSFKNKC
jgi:hypothetical protein